LQFKNALAATQQPIILHRMDTRAITEAAATTLAGTLPFPEIVAKLIATGVEYYHVDYAGACKQFYDGVGGRVVTPVPYEGLPVSLFGQ
jgi:hypothetical protein